MIPFLNVLQYLALVLWVGSMFGFGVLYAPVLFGSLSSREQAGSIAGDTLARIDTMGLVTGGIMLVITALQAIDSHFASIDLGRLLNAAVMLGLVILSATTIRQRLNAVRSKLGRPIDEIPEGDPVRREYGRAHALSRALFTVNMLLGCLLIGLSALR
ncbi:MAG: DUF4149 domain-containing protein [Mycobacterium leprae]